MNIVIKLHPAFVVMLSILPCCYRCTMLNEFDSRNMARLQKMNRALGHLCAHIG